MLNWIVKADTDDRDCLCGIPGCQRRRGRRRNDDVHLAPDQFGSQAEQTVVVAFSIPIIDGNARSLIPSKLPQSFPERVLKIRDSSARREIADEAY